MKLEDIVVSLELAKELKKAGYPQDSLFSYVLNLKESYQLVHDRASNYIKEVDPISAPTVSELLERLPEGLFVRKLKNKYFGCRYHDDVNIFSVFTKANSAADAAAKMWLDLKENN